MKKHMLDILACPIDKNYPLELIELNVKDLEKEFLKENNYPINNEEEQNNFIKKNNRYKVNQENEIKDNEKVIVIIDGILYCKKCSRFYPIIDEIPIMLPDELREKENDLQFLKKWKDCIPEDILKNSNPWHL
ncbi:MAG TPA: Trm112 family protein [Nitrososphaeraceae archaeon]